MRKNFILFLLYVFWCLGCSAAVVLTGETNRPKNSMYAIGEEISLNFKGTGFAPGESSTLKIVIRDYQGKIIKNMQVPVKAGQDGVWAGSVAMPNDRYGYYRTSFQLPGGVTTARLGSRPAGQLPYVVLPDPTTRKFYPVEDSVFGIHGKSVGLDRWIGSRWQGVGVEIEEHKVKEAIRQYGIQSSRPDYQLAHQYVTLLCPCRPWWRHQYSFKASELKKYLTPNGFTENGGRKFFTDYYRRMAVQGKRQKFHNKVMRYQILWEPDLTFSNLEILKWYQVAHAGIKAGDPEALILGPCFHSINRDLFVRLEELFEMGFLKYIDEFTIHPYIKYPVEQNGLVENIRYLKQMIRRYSGGRDIKIRANESGYNALSTIEQELIQMHGQVRTMLIALGEGFASIEPFCGYDYLTECHGDWGVCYNLSMPKRIWAPLGVAPRPVFAALAAASYILEGHRPTGAIEYLGDTVLGYSYADRNDNCVIALWDFGGHNTEVEIPVGREEIELSDVMGNRSRVRTRDGQLHLKLSESPVYVLGGDPRLWGRKAEKHIVLKNKILNGIVGDSVTLAGKIDVRGQLQLSFPVSMKKNPVTLPVAQNGEFSYSMQIPSYQNIGKYPLILKLWRDGRMAAAAGVIMEVAAPVRLERIQPYFEKNNPGLQLECSNLTNYELKGVFETRIPGYPEARRKFPFKLKAGEKRIYQEIFEDLEIDPFQNVETEVRVALDTGYAFKIMRRLNFLAAEYVPGAGEKGIFSSWKHPVYHKVHPAPVRSMRYHSGASDLSAKIAVGWNEKYLLFDIRVHDDIFLQPYQDWWIWNGDALQLGLAREQQIIRTNNDFGDRCRMGASEINFSLTRQGAQANRTGSFDQDRFKLGNISEAELPRCITVKSDPSGGSVIHYQLAVPWNFMNLDQIGPGMTVYWGALINDRDQDQEKQIDISSLGVFELHQNPPKNFGIIFLSR